VVVVTPITAEGFAPFGEVIAEVGPDDREAATRHWTELARQRYGGEVLARSLTLPARAPELGFIEAHPNSPQLSVAFDSAWILTVVPGIAPGTEVGRSADVSSAQSFLVQPGVGVILREALWHGPVTSLSETAALVIFREGVVDVWTELDDPTPLVVPAGS
jgi:ureidoglycolate lyase